MPRIWLDYCQFLMDQCRITRTRRTFDRALRALPITQHHRIWPLYLRFVRLYPLPETAVRVYRRYLKVRAHVYPKKLLMFGSTFCDSRMHHLKHVFHSLYCSLKIVSRFYFCRLISVVCIGQGQKKVIYFVFSPGEILNWNILFYWYIQDLCVHVLFFVFEELSKIEIKGNKILNEN